MDFTIVLAIFLCFAKAHADNDGNCEIVSSDIDWTNNLILPTPIRDVDPLKISFDYTGVLGIANVDNSTFVTVTASENVLTFEGTDAYANLDLYIPTQAGPYIIIVNVQFSCQNGITRLTLRQEVQDTNNNPPTFAKPSYAYSIPMPMMPRIDYTTLGDFIVATDLDFTNQDVTFTIDPPDFHLSTVSLGNKEYRTIMTVLQITRFSGEQTYTITATDSGDPVLSSTAAITISIDATSSITDIPTFSSPSYSMDYSEDEGGQPLLTPKGGPITVKTDLPDKTHVTGDDDEFFDVQYNPSNGQVDVKVKKVIEKATSNVIILTLTATIDGETENARSVVVVNIPDGNIISVPQFSAPYYTARYLVEGENHQVVVDGIITVTDNADEVTVVLAGNNKDNFKLNKIDDSSWNLIVTQNLPDDVLNKGQDIILSLEASTSGVSGTGQGTIIVSLPTIAPSALPKFSKTHYTATYHVTEEGIAEVMLSDGPILVTAADEDNLKVSIVDSYTSNFKLDYKGSPQITVIKTLDDGVLSKESDILLTVEASLPGVAITATILLQLPLSDAAKAPVFEKSHYTAVYKVQSGGLSTVEIIDGPVRTSSDDDASLQINLVESYTENFSFDYSNQQIIVLQPLDPDVISHSNDILLVVQASVDSSSATNTAVILLQIRTMPIPEFSKIYYNGIYEVDSEGIPSAELSDGPISISSSTDSSLIVTLIDSYADNFRIDYTNPNQIVVTKPLDGAVLSQESEILLTVEASLDGAIEDGHAVILLKLPKIDTTVTPKFSQSSYVLIYKVEDDGTDVVDLNGETIRLTNDDGGLAVVNTVGDYKDNFEVERNDDTKEFSLRVINNLPDDVLRAESDIIVTLDAKFESSADGYATLLIKLPDLDLLSSPKFKQISYLATYELGDTTDSVKMENDAIGLVDSDEDVTVEIIDSYNNHFDVRQSGQNYEIIVKENLASEDFDSNIEIILNLKASLVGATDAGYATVVVNLPPKISGATFTEPYYTAQYVTDASEKDQVQVTNGPIKINAASGVDQLTVTPQGDQAANFEILSQGDGTYVLNLKANLDDATLNNNKEIIITLEAEASGLSGKTTVPIIITMPENGNFVAIPKFSDHLYVATYTVIDGALDDITLSDDQQIIIDGDSTGLTTIQVSEPYGDNFKINFDSTRYVISVSKDLDDDILKQNTELVVTLDAVLDGAPDHGYANMIIKLPEQVSNVVPQFGSPYYTADYVVLNNRADAVELSGAITISTGQADETVVRVTGPFEDNFRAQYQDNSWQILVVTDLDQAVLNTEREIILILTATLEGTPETGTAILVVNLPATELLAAPTFTQAYYTANYVIELDSSASLVMTSDPVAINGIDEAKVQVTLVGKYSDHFNLLRDNAKQQWVLSIRTPLDSAILERETQLLFELDAKLAGASGDGCSALILNLPLTSKILHFDSTFYLASYIINDDATDSITSDAIFVNDDEAAVSVVGAYQNNFDVECLNHVCHLVIKEPLDVTVLNTESDLIVALQAKKIGVVDVATATIIVSLPLKDAPRAPQFTKTVYTATYSLDAELDKVEVDNGPITIIGHEFNTVSLTLSGANVEYFTLARNGEDGFWTLSVARNLPQDILERDNSVILTVSAYLEGVSLPGTSTLVVKLPKEVSPTDIYFTDVVYMSTYVENDGSDKLAVQDEIKIEGTSLDQVEVSLTGEYGRYFTAKYNPENGEVTIALASDLPDNILEKTSVITVNIEANLKGSTAKVSAGLVIKLPLAQGDGDDDDCMSSHTKTVYIAVICVLAALLTSLIVGTAAFYYFRIRGRSNYADMDDYIATENRFTRNPKVSEIKKFDHPTRRPTGIINFSLTEEVGPRESTTDINLDDQEKERRKSVAFDETVEEREIDTRDDDEKDASSDVEYHEPTEKQNHEGNNVDGNHHEQRTEL